jgi:GDP-L-fucose synthase
MSKAELTLATEQKIYIAGHRGMVGSAVWRCLSAAGFNNIIGVSSGELDLRNQHAVEVFFEKERPEIVIDAAAIVGGIVANQENPYPFLMSNLQIQNNLIDAAFRHKARKFIFLGSSCIYPKLSPQPIREEYLLSGYLEPSNEWYAIAKIAGLKACEAIRKQYKRDFVSLMPTNLYGPNDNFDLKTSHVLPAMIRKFHEAKEKSEPSVVLWGSGTPMREFLHVDDLAKAVLHALQHKLTASLYNVGTGKDLSIKELANLVSFIVGYEGDILWDTNYPDGTPKKLLDVSRLHDSGWKATISLKQGIQMTYQWFLDNQLQIRQLTH